MLCKSLINNPDIFYLSKYPLPKYIESNTESIMPNSQINQRRNGGPHSPWALVGLCNNFNNGEMGNCPKHGGRRLAKGGLILGI